MNKLKLPMIKKSTKYDKPLKYYGDLLFSHRTKGATEKFAPLDNVSNQIGYNRIVSRNYVSYLIQVQAFQDTLAPDVLSHIRKKLKTVHSGKIYVDLLMRTKSHHVKWNSTSMKINVSTWKDMKANSRKKKQKEKEEGYSSGVDDQTINWENRREASWKYLKQCEADGTQLGLTACVFRIRVPKDDKIYVKLLFEILQDAFITFNIVPKLINTYIYDAVSEMSPFKHEGTELASKLIADRVLSTKITSKFSPLSQGALNRGNIILGNDLKNRRLVYMDTHPQSGKSTNGLIVSSSGSGKSVLAKSVCEQVIAQPDYLYIVDYERNEYTPFGDTYGATYLDLMGGDGKYYDPLKFGNLTGIEDIDNGILKMAVQGTQMMISIMLEKTLTVRQKKLIDMALKEYSISLQMDFNDRTTWHNAQKMSIKGLLPKLRNYSASSKLRLLYGKDLEELVDTLELYFEGVESYMFKYPISFDELRDKRIIIVRFGGDSKEELVGSEPVDVQINQLTIMLLIQELARYRKIQGDSFVILLEELQRYLQHKGSVSWVNTMYTGVRKCNGAILGIINDPEKLNQNLSALINNSEYVIVGENKNTEALSYMYKTPTLSGCEKQVSSLANLEHAFLIRSKSGLNSIFRVELPKQYLESPIYKSRTDAS